MKKKLISLAIIACLILTTFCSTSMVAFSLNASSWNNGDATVTGNDTDGYDITGTAFQTPRTWVEESKRPDVADLKMKFDIQDPENQGIGNWFYMSVHVNDSGVNLSNFEGITLLLSKTAANKINVQSWEQSNTNTGGVSYSLTGEIDFDYSAEHTYGFSLIENEWYFRLDGVVYKNHAVTDGMENLFEVCETINATPQYAFTAQCPFTIENLRWVNREPYSVSATFNQTGKYGVSWHSAADYKKPQIQYGLDKDAPVAPETFASDWSVTSDCTVTGSEDSGFDIIGNPYRVATIQKNGDFSKHDLKFKFTQITNESWGYMAITKTASVNPDNILPTTTLDGLYILFHKAGNDVNVMLWNGTSAKLVFAKIANFDFAAEHTLGFRKSDNKWYMAFDGVTYTESNGGTDLTSYLSALVNGNNYYCFSGNSNYKFEDLKFVNTDTTVANTNKYLSVASATKKLCTAQSGSDYSYKGVIGNVKAGETYYYRVGDATTGLFGEWRSFTAQEGDDTAFTFVYVTDTHIGGGNTVDGKLWPSVMAAAAAEHGDSRFILHTGDLVDGLDDYTQWKDAFSDKNGGIGAYLKNTLITSVAGSYHESTASELYDHFNFYIPDDQDTSNGVYYSYDYNDAHFVMIDVNDITAVDTTTYSGGLRAALSTKQESWLREDLSSTDKSWKIVGLHWSLYGSGGSAQEAPVRALRNYLVKIFDEYDVDLVLSGHDHIFDRTKPIYSKSDISDYWNSGEVREGLRTETQYGGDDVVFDINPNGTVFLQTGSIATNKASTNQYSYTGLYDKQGEVALPMYTAITVDGDKLVIKSYTVQDGESTLYDSYGLLRDTKADSNGDNTIDICDLVSVNRKTAYEGQDSDVAELRSKLLSYYAR